MHSALTQNILAPAFSGQIMQIFGVQPSMTAAHIFPFELSAGVGCEGILNCCGVYCVVAPWLTCMGFSTVEDVHERRSNNLPENDIAASSSPTFTSWIHMPKVYLKNSGPHLSCWI